MLVEGEAEVVAPRSSQTAKAVSLPGLTVRSHEHFDKLLERARPLPPLVTAVVAPEDHKSLGGALLAAENTLIEPILIGSQSKIQAAADRIGKDLTHLEIIDIESHTQAAARAVAMVREGKAQSIMKGQLHTDVLLAQIVKRDIGLRTDNRLSMCLLWTFQALIICFSSPMRPSTLHRIWKPKWTLCKMPSTGTGPWYPSTRWAFCLRWKR